MSGPLRDRRNAGPRRGKRPVLQGPQRPMPPGRTMGFWLVVILLLFLGFQILNLDKQQEYP